jgi:small-conductance mechanosensitive channel
MTSTNLAERVANTEIEKKTKQSVLKKIILLGIILVIALSLTTGLLGPLIPREFLVYAQIAQFALIGYIVMEVISNSAFKVATIARQSKQAAKSIKSLIRILGSLIITAIVISYLSENPALAAAIGTITGVVIGFAAQNVIGNLIAGMYLTLARPFKIEDNITVLGPTGQTGRVSDIGLLYSGLHMNTGDTVLVPNTLLITNSIILKGEENDKSDIPAPLYIW